MPDYVTLIGSEDVQRAGNAIASAAVEITRAAGYMAETLDRHRQAMEDCVQRMEALAAREKGGG